jgi:hypothetical protein
MERYFYSETADRKATLERILQQQQHPLFTRLASVWEDVQRFPDAWTFPAEEGGASGFAGLAPIFVIAEQPSRSKWPPGDKGRRLLYDSLVEFGVGDVHLTDIVKTRGKPHEWKEWPDERLQPHIDFLRRELDELKPQRMILLGEEARQLFSRHFPGKALAAPVPHFGYLQWVPAEDRERWRDTFRNQLRKALGL